MLNEKPRSHNDRGNIWSFALLLTILVFFINANIPVAEQENLPLSNQEVIEGRTNNEMVSRFENLPENSSITVTSAGGDANSAFQIGQIVFDRNISVRVEDVCASSCAEFILPSASNVIIGQNALIGFHLNDFAFEQIAKERGLSENLCSSRRTPFLRQIYLLRRMNTNFFKEVLNRLNLTDYEPVQVPTGCSSQRTWTNYLAWFPTSVQLKELWGLTFDGNVCADAEICYRRRLGET